LVAAIPWPSLHLDFTKTHCWSEARLNEAAWRRTHPRVPDGQANLAWLIRLAQIFIRGFLRKPYRVSHLLLEIPSHEKLAIPQLVHEGDSGRIPQRLLDFRLAQNGTLPKWFEAASSGAISG
jgi:hypothetical protein